MPAWAAWERGIKRSLLVWHRRAGKDELSLNKAAVAAMMRPANYWHGLPQFNQARRAIWEAVNPHTGKKRIDEAFPKEIRTRTDQTTMTIEFVSGSVWRVVGLDNPDSLVGAPPAGIVLSEFALSNPSPYAYLSPIINENNGWIDIITTPRGNNHVAKLYAEHKDDPKWFVERLTVDDTGVIPHERIEEDRRTYTALFGEEAANAIIQQEYWCSFEAAILGAYYAREMELVERENRIGVFEPWPNCPINTAWDLGVSRGGNTMAVWDWQIVPTDTGEAAIYVLNFDTATGYGIPYYAKRARERRERWAAQLKQRNSSYELPHGTDFVPHDARTPEMTSSGKDGKAKQRIEVMIEQGLKPKIVANHHVADGISAARQVFRRFRFDKHGCGIGLDALREYQTEWDDDLKKFKDTPLNNWAAHPADGIRYLAMAYRELRAEKPKEPGRMLSVGDGINQLPPGVKGVTLNDLWDMQKRPSRRI
jgi:phage terminase large subunit